MIELRDELEPAPGWPGCVFVDADDDLVVEHCAEVLAENLT